MDTYRDQRIRNRFLLPPTTFDNQFGHEGRPESIRRFSSDTRRMQCRPLPIESPI